MSISSSELRQRKPVSSVTNSRHGNQESDLKKQKPLIRKENNGSKDYLIALALFIISLPIRFKNISNPDQVV